MTTRQTPAKQYVSELQRHGFRSDPAQLAAVGALDELFQRLLSTSHSDSPGWSGWWRKVRGNRLAPVTGLYLWGGVGRGKTFLMDLFYDCLPFERKSRMHFHRFMQMVHRQLTELSGTANPLSVVADQFAENSKVLCFDEFFVSDIGDAMILGELMTALFERGVTLVATSNIPPANLYANGLQRARFLPVIDLLQKYTLVHCLDGPIDYRLRALERAEIYHSPLDSSAFVSLSQSFDALAPEKPVADTTLEIEKRLINVFKVADDVIWFEFVEICDGPRSQNDYIEIARIFHAVIVSQVPCFKSHNEDQARRFISLVDEFYDHNVKLILSAEVGIEYLYQGSRFVFEFERTQSRLLEMRSHAYLGRSHKA